MQSTPIALPAQPERIAMTPASPGTPKDIRQNCLEAQRDFTRLVASLALAAAEHGQGTFPMILQLTPEGMPRQDAVSRPPGKRPADRAHHQSPLSREAWVKQREVLSISVQNGCATRMASPSEQEARVQGMKRDLVQT